MKPAFQNLEVDLWVHAGKLGIAQPSICLFHDRREEGFQILEAIVELVNEDRPAQRTITFKPCSRPHALGKLKLKVESIGDDLKIMHIGFDRATATIEMTDEGLSLLKNALRTWLAGGEDFGVSPRHGSLKSKAIGKLDKESGELWFWGPGYLGP